MSGLKMLWLRALMGIAVWALLVAVAGLVGLL